MIRHENSVVHRRILLSLLLGHEHVGGQERTLRGYVVKLVLLVVLFKQFVHISTDVIQIIASHDPATTVLGPAYRLM